MTDGKELHYRYNLFYGSVFLLAIIVVLITIKWGCIQGLVEYISFGLTLTSLFLAFIAIIYAIISNMTFSQHLGKLGNVTDNVVEAASNLSSMTHNLEEKLREIPELIRKVDSKLDETRKDIKAGVNQQSTPAITQQEQKASDSGNTIPDDFLKNFLTTSSFNGMLALFTAQIAYSTKKPFDISKVWIGTTLEEPYGYGYLVACSAAGFLGHTTNDRMWSITNFTPQITDLRARMITWIEERANKEPENFNVEKDTARTIVAIENYFKD